MVYHLVVYINSSVLTNILKLIYHLLFGYVISAQFFQSANASTSIQLETSIKNFHYTEYAEDNSILNRESGSVPGLGAKFNHSLSFVEFEINADVYAGLIDYDGQTQGGTPYKTQTDTVISDIGLLARFQLVPQQHFITVSYGNDLWRRDILPNNGILGLYETYRWSTMKMGYEYRQRSGSHLIIFATEYLQHSNSEMKINFDGINPATIPLKDAAGWQGRIGYVYEFYNKWLLSIQYQYQQWSSERSENVLIDSQFGQVLIHEPRSKTLSDNFKIYLNYQF